MRRNKELIELFNRGASNVEKNPELGAFIIKRALTMMPYTHIGWYNLGLAYHQLGKIEAAIESYKKAIEYSSPTLEEAIENLAQDLLLAGRWKEGWKYYENRLNKMAKNMTIYHKMYGEMWTGLNDKRECNELIIVSEQGYGDTLQFCRFMKNIEELNVRSSYFVRAN